MRAFRATDVALVSILLVLIAGCSGALPGTRVAVVLLLT
jgi:hypothetical protein